MWKVTEIALRSGNCVYYGTKGAVSRVKLYNTDTQETKVVMRLENDMTSWSDILRSHCDGTIPLGYYSKNGVDNFFFIYSSFGSELYDLLTFSFVANHRISSRLEYMINTWDYIAFKTEKGWMTLEEIVLNYWDSCEVNGNLLYVGTQDGEAVVYSISDVKKFNRLITKGKVLGNEIRK